MSISRYTSTIYLSNGLVKTLTVTISMDVWSFLLVTVREMLYVPLIRFDRSNTGRVSDAPTTVYNECNQIG